MRLGNQIALFPFIDCWLRMFETHWAVRQSLGLWVAPVMHPRGRAFVKVSLCLPASRGACAVPGPQQTLPCIPTSHRSVSSFQGYAKDMVTDFDEKHDEYLILLQQRNR